MAIRYVFLFWHMRLCRGLAEEFVYYCSFVYYNIIIISKVR